MKNIVNKAWCPQCKAVKMRKNLNVLMLPSFIHKEHGKVVRAYCCAREGGPEKIGKVFEIWRTQ